MLVYVGIWSCLALFVGAPIGLEAKGRDADASRMQARKIDFPSSHSDKLNPPEDRIDWRYFKLDEATRVSLRATFDASGSDAQLGLTTATGREIAGARADRAGATIVQRLDPGVYYIRVQAESETSYKLVVR